MLDRSSKFWQDRYKGWATDPRVLLWLVPGPMNHRHQHHFRFGCSCGRYSASEYCWASVSSEVVCQRCACLHTLCVLAETDKHTQKSLQPIINVRVRNRVTRYAPASSPASALSHFLPRTLCFILCSPASAPASAHFECACDNGSSSCSPPKQWHHMCVCRWSNRQLT